MDWSHRLLSTVSYASTTFSHGDLSAGAVSTAAARILTSNKIRRMNDGSERVVSTMLVTETALPYGARVWLPGANTANIEESFQVLGVETASMLDGSYTLYRVDLGA